MGNIIFGELDERQTIKVSVHQNKLTIELVNKCGGRCHVNQQDEYSNNQLLEEQILKTIEETLEANGGSCCTDDIAKAVAEIIQRDKEHIRQSSGHMSEKEMKEQPKGSIFKRLLIKLAGITTGALVGAPFGLVLIAGEVVTVAKKYSQSGQTLKVMSDVRALAVLIGGTKRAFATLATVSAAGAIKGGLIGYDAAEGANTLLEAAKRAAKAVKNEAFKVLGI